ncbi:MAG: substrate-binding domain-containing protein [Armatimonadota bacterium]
MPDVQFEDSAIDTLISNADGDARRLLNLIEQITEVGLPVVLLDRYVEGSGLDTVISDNFDGSYRCTQHLVRLGHRHIAYIGYPSCTPVVDRVAGYRKCLMDNGICPDQSIIVQQHPRRDPAATATAMERMIEHLPSVTAVMAANDDLATDVWASLSKMGLRVPEDLVLAGYDNANGKAGPTAMLTTVEQPLHDMGRLASRMIIERMEGYSGEPRLVTLESRFVVGRSTSAHSEGEPLPKVSGTVDQGVSRIRQTNIGKQGVIR